jgi:hypothetical protein
MCPAKVDWGEADSNAAARLIKIALAAGIENEGN